MRRLLCLVLLGAGCAPEGGGITARLEFGTVTPGLVRRELRVAAPPSGVGRLVIEVLDGDAPLASTVLALRPEPGEALLQPEGGRWRIDGVPAGRMRSLRARAFLDDRLGPTGTLLFEGQRDDLVITAGATTDAGALRLEPVGNRNPAFDFEPPPPPSLEVTAPSAGEALVLSWSGPEVGDLGGYLVATTRTSTAVPIFRRGARWAPGETTQGLTVETLVAAGARTTLTLNGLADGSPVRVLLYAFDADATGAPLNWSAPAEAVATPQDTLPPNAPSGLTANLSGRNLRLDYVGPGEDGDEGTPDRYELRIAAPNVDLGENFDLGTALSPPAVAPPGTTVSTVITVPIDVSQGFTVAARAIDAAGNEGAVSALRVNGPGGVTARIDRVIPALPIAGAELQVVGEGFGTTGTAEWVETSTVRPVTVTSWQPDRVVVVVPAEARSGELVLGAVRQALGVLVRRDAGLPAQAPFVLLGGAVDGNGLVRVHAVHREAGRFGTPNHGVERYIDGVLEGFEHVPLRQRRSPVVSGDYRVDVGVFGFVSGGESASLTTAVVSGDPVAANATRVVTGVAAGAVDGLSLMLLAGGTADRIPAFLAFTRTGALRAARVDNMRLDVFDNFSAYTSTAAAFESVDGVRTAAGAGLLGVLARGTTTELTLWDVPQDGAPEGLTRRPGARPSEGFVVRAIPAQALPTSDVLIAHESSGPSSSIWLGLASAFPAGFERVLFGEDLLRIEDLGFIDTAQGVRVVILASRLLASRAELLWAEVPLSAVLAGTAATAVTVAPVDLADDAHRARLGCRAIARECWALWAHYNEAQVLFVRR